MTPQPATPPRPARLARVATYPLRLGGPGEDWRSTRFGRLALVNLLSSAGDALVVVALAGSVFVSVPLNAARGRTALGLVCTLLPFALVAPLIGPAADRTRRGKRFVLFLAATGRTAAALMMMEWLHSLLLFPAAFLSLVCSRTHTVARSSLVPGSMDGHSDLVRANSRLAIGSGVSAAAGAGVGGAIYFLFGSRSVLQVDAAVFAMTAALALLVPRPAEVPAAERSAPLPRPEAPSPGTGLRRPALLMAGTRGMAGFMTALIAFGFRDQGAPVIWYGLAAGAGVLGNLGGAALSPATRRAVRSEAWVMGLGCLAIAVTAALVVLLGAAPYRAGAVMLAGAAGIGGTLAKTAFDSLVQINVADAGRARAFARFEALFQCSWVILALIPTLVPVPMTAGFVLIAAVLAGLGLDLALHVRGTRVRAD